MLGSLFAASSLIAFGVMLSKAVEVKNQGYYPPTKAKPSKVVIDPGDVADVSATDQIVIPANDDLIESIRQRSEGSDS